ncbi:hypothetical protein [Streptomyces sp. NPDC060194]|uniref:hypothetical protein n=1 Tax=Streptomyces sp. NPDC060194 TaxID=3347069 RepID=UPI00364EE632
MTRDEIKTGVERALLSAAEVPEFDYSVDDDGRTFGEVWAVNSAPADARIFSEKCSVCASRTTHMAGSKNGQREILAATCFCEMNRARAIGGAASMLVDGVRATALADPDDPFSRRAVELVSSTVFKLLLRDPRKVSSEKPASIAACTLFFLHDCSWQRSGASLILRLALLKMDLADDVAGAARIFRAMDEEINRASLLRSPGGIDLLLTMDGVLQSVELLSKESAHCQESCAVQARDVR